MLLTFELCEQYLRLRARKQYMGQSPEVPLLIGCSWSHVANMLYVDSPAGVGLSYAETPADLVTNDTRTVADMDTFLRRWFRQYTEFQANDFYVSGQHPASGWVVLSLTLCRWRGGEGHNEGWWTGGSRRFEVVADCECCLILYCLYPVALSCRRPF
jgi:hypothetical protein